MTEAVDLDPLERLETLSARLQEARDRHRLGDALDAALQAVNGAESAISRLEQLAGVTALVGGFLDRSDWEQCHRLLHAVRGVGHHVTQASDPATLHDAATRVSQLQGQISQTDGLLHRGWKTKIDHAFAATGRLGSVLREIPETQQLGSEMEVLIHRAEQLAASLDDAERSAAQFRTLTTERDRTKDKLAAIGAGEEVVNFLLAVAERNATLANVSAGVGFWLDKRNALERFKVRL